MIKRTLIITLILNAFIVIAVPEGHGYGIMSLIEYIGFRIILENGIVFEKEYAYQVSLLAVAITSFIGKAIIIGLLFSKHMLKRRHVIYMGLSLMLIAFFLACNRALNYNNFLFGLTIGSGIPFLMYCGRVLCVVNREFKKSMSI